jgi:ATP-dependent helicase Lhr and Lhr-like helicase
MSGIGEIEQVFRQRGWSAFPFQRQVWQAWEAGKSGLLHAPTGQGKTLAVYLGPLRETCREADGCRILWLTPMRALAADTLRALREAQSWFSPTLQAEARTGDTDAATRSRLRRKLPHTLVTTPESLSLMLTHADFAGNMAGLRAVIVDEWHELLGTKRGVQAELCLARLRAWLPGLRIWGLSATLGNRTEAREALLGSAMADSVEIAALADKPARIESLIPQEMERFPWAGHLGLRLAPAVAAAVERGGTTLLFTNTRSQAELWFQELQELRPAWSESLALHHGSLDPAERRRVEDGLRQGALRCVVATSSLDLGVDFSPVDQVIQVGSPKGIARLLQRAGRAGHHPGGTPRILCVPTHAFELVEFAAARDAAAAGEIEARPPLEKPLDVLAQHLVTCAIGKPFAAAEMLREVRSSHAYRELSEEEWNWVLGFISDGGKALASYPRYRKARLEHGLYFVDDPALIRQHRVSIGTISADQAVTVKFANGRTLGSVEESFVSRLKPGAALIFAGRHLTLVRLHQKTATVKAATKPKGGPVAVWGGGKMPLSTELAQAVGRRLRGEGAACGEMTAVAPILHIQREQSRIPQGSELLVEHARSRDGEHLFFFPLAGRLVHEGLSALVAWRLARQAGEAIQTTQNDYGFSLSARRGLWVGETDLRESLSPENLLEDLLACMNTAELARRQFREIARVSGLILNPPPGRPARGARELQASASLLYEVLDRYDPENLLLRQARREILERQLEIHRLRRVLEELARRPLVWVETPRFTPMAFPLWAERLRATLPPGDAASRLEAMLRDLTRHGP